jgi:hypothetical protein
MPTFKARIANFIVPSQKPFSLNLKGMIATFTPEPMFTLASRQSLRGHLVRSSVLTLDEITSYEQGEELTVDLCFLLSFGLQSQIVPYEFKYETRGRTISALATYNSWRPVFDPNDDKAIRSFMEGSWDGYLAKRDGRAIRSTIDLINYSTLPSLPIELELANAVICLESIKSYFAICEGYNHNVSESNGSFYIGKRTATFEELLTLSLHDVGMTMPTLWDDIKNFRNALVHRGFIRATDGIASTVFGISNEAELYDRMFKVLDAIHDVLREYVLRLIGYKGRYLTYSSASREYGTII